MNQLTLSGVLESEAAFSRAFKRTVGISPGAARRSSPDTLPETPHLVTG